MSKRALMVVDVQHDFLPGGALAVEHGDQVIPVIENLARDYDLIVFSQDYHPAETEHFKRWPVHCVRGTEGAQLHPSISELFHPERGDLRVIKGTGDKDDGYSAFEGRPRSIMKYNRTLAEHLRERGIEEIDVVGLAYDFCVQATATDAAKEGFKSRVLYNATRAVFPDNDQKVTDELRRAGVEVA